MSNIQDSSIEIESLKLCVTAERKAEKTFIRYSIAMITTIFLINIAKFKETLKVPVLGEISSKLITDNIIFIIIFIASLMMYAFFEWVITIIDLNRHSLYDRFSKKRSLAVLMADKWDNYFRYSFLKTLTILDILQNLMFFIIFILLFLFLIKKSVYG